MSLLPQQTTISPGLYFFIEANGKQLTVSTLNANNISCATGYVSSLASDFISSGTAFIHDLEASTLFGLTLQLDNQVLTATPTELLLNGIPIATASNLSSIGDWALEPAISTVNLNGNNIINGNLSAISSVSTVNLQATNILAQNIVALNILALSSYQSTVSSVHLTTDELFTSSLNGVNISTLLNPPPVSTLSLDSLSTPQIISLSSINGLPISHYEPGGVSTVSTFQTASVSSLTASTINNQPYISGSNWSAYPANSVVDLANNQIYNATVINGPNNLVLNAPSGLISTVCEDMEITADEGANITTNATINMTAKNGLKGEVNITADVGYADIGGVVNIQANGGVTPLGVAYGGEVNITATTGTFTSLALTSAVNLSASGINSYAGASAPIGSLTGFNFMHGDAGANITAGVPPIFSDPLCVYIRGTNGVLVDSTSYMRNIRPYSDSVQNPVDIYIEDYSNLITHGYVQLRGVSTQTFAGGDTAVLGVNKIHFSTAGGELQGLSSINGLPVEVFQNTSTLSTFQELFTSSLRASTIETDVMVTNFGSFSSLITYDLQTSLFTTDTLTTDTASISSLTVSSLTGIPFNTSQWANYPAISTIIFASGTPALIKANPGNNILIEGRNVQLVGDFTYATTLFLTPAVSTATILGANSNLFGVGIQGLEIDAENLFLSSPNVTHPGTFNGNQILSIYSRSVTASISSLTASTINGSVPALQDTYNSFSSITTSTLFSPNIVTDRLFVSTQISGDIVASDSTKNIISSFSSIQASGGLFGNLNTNNISSGKLTVSSITLFNANLSTTLVARATPNPGVGTSTCLVVNTDVNLGANDLYCQQIRLGLGQLDNFAEILMYGNDGSTKNLLAGTADRTFRVASSVAPTGPGYVLDTALNPPFFSTINQSTALCAYFPSSVANTIGVSTISFQPPKVVAGTFFSLSTQNITQNVPLALWSETTDFTTGGITTSTNALVIPTAGIYEITTSIQYTKAGGAGIADWWFRVNGVDLENTASEIYLPAGGSGQALGNITLSKRFNAGDKIQVMVASPDTGVSATFLQSTISPYTRPAVPSVITGIKCLNY